MIGFIAFTASFLLGSVPTAFLLVRRASGMDLRREGTGNIGALNAFEVSRSKRIGIAVLLIDAVKGAVPVAIAMFAPDARVAGAAYIGVVLGHNFSPWIGFRGGRGLASAAGAALVFNAHLFLLWGALWLVFFFPKRNVHHGNLAATILMPGAFALLASFRWAIPGLPAPTCVQAGIISVVCLIILLGHRSVISEMWKGR